MDTKEIRARLAGRLSATRAAFEPDQPVQLAIDPQEFLALTAEHCPAKLVDFRDTMRTAKLLPTHVLLGLPECEALTETPVTKAQVTHDDDKKRRPADLSG